MLNVGLAQPPNSRCRTSEIPVFVSMVRRRRSPETRYEALGQCWAGTDGRRSVCCDVCGGTAYVAWSKPAVLCSPLHSPQRKAARPAPTAPRLSASVAQLFPLLLSFARLRVVELEPFGGCRGRAAGRGTDEQRFTSLCGGAGANSGRYAPASARPREALPGCPSRLIR